MGFDLPPAELVAELDATRTSRGLSYQAVADACGVSKATIYRTLTGATEPTMQLLQDIAAAVQYAPKSAATVPEDGTPEAYNAWLCAELDRRDEEHDRRVRQLHAHYNRLRAEDHRTIVWTTICLAAVLGFLIFWLILDITHPTIGWIQREIAAHETVSTALEWAAEIFL